MRFVRSRISRTGYACVTARRAQRLLSKARVTLMASTLLNRYWWAQRCDVVRTGHAQRQRCNRRCVRRV